jgi:hypothetical protein
MIYLGLIRSIAAVALIGAAGIGPAVADDLAPSGAAEPRIARGMAVAAPTEGDVHPATRTARGATPLPLADPLLEGGTLETAATLGTSARLPRGG